MATPSTPDIIKFGLMVVPDRLASALPLEKTEVTGTLAGLTASVTVRQYFSNPLLSSADLEYIFPLQEEAAIVDFAIQIGTRRIKGEVKELEQAREAYEEARHQGKHSALLESRRRNLFAVHIANVQPGESIQAMIQYHQPLLFRDGEVEFVFPMGLTPRYHSPGHLEEAEGVNPPIALPGEPVGPIDLDLTVDPGLKSKQPTSPSHALQVSTVDENKYKVKFANKEIPDHDFVLRVPLPGQDVHGLARCGQDQSGEFLLVNWLPPAVEPAAPPPPREFVFVLDRSGSMSGQPILQARNALRACLRILESKDTFRILLFDDRLEWYRQSATRVSQKEIEKVDAFLESVEGRGGTEILQAIDAALDLPPDPQRMRLVLFLTDGAVSAEERALVSVRKKATQTRIFTFGIGPSVNRSLLTNLSRIGRGEAEFLQLDEDIEGAILRFQDKVSFPILTDLQLHWQNCTVWDTYPSILPDLYAGQPLQLSARLKRDQNGPARLALSGNRAGLPELFELNLPSPDPSAVDVRWTWARARVDDLIEQSASGRELAHQARQEIISLALEYHLLTPYTAFVAIDSEAVNSTGQSLSLLIAQPLPKGLDIEGFFPTGLVSYSMNAVHAISPTRRRRAADSRALLSSLISAPGLGGGDESDDTNSLDLPAFLSKRTPASAPAEGEPSQAHQERRPDPVEILRKLVRTQNLDGSWSSGIAFTAAALLALVRNGHTTRAGSYRKQVQRAFDWLARTPGHGTATFLRALAFFELASATGDPNHVQAARKASQELPKPKAPFECAVCHVLGHSIPCPPAPTAIQSVEELQMAVALKIHLEVPPDVLKMDSSGLSQVLMSAL